MSVSASRNRSSAAVTAFLSAFDVIASVHIFHVSGKGRGAVAYKEGGEVSHVLNAD
jgi:hypothetical protein